MLLIDQGEKKLITRSLKDENGSDIPFVNIISLTFTLVSNNQDRYTFSIANGDIVETETGVKIEFEEETTAQWNRGVYDLKTIIEVNDTRFSNPVVDIQTEQEWARVLGPGQSATGDNSSTESGTINFEVIVDLGEVEDPSVANKTITVDNQTESSFDINWSKATSNDINTASNQLNYKIYEGEQSALNDEALIQSQVFLGSSTDINTFTVTADQPKFVNVLVEDLSNNKSIYSAVQGEPLEPEVLDISTTTGDFTGDPGETFQIDATVAVQDDADDTVLYSSQDTNIATVDSSGLVTLQDGSASNFTTNIRVYSQFDNSFELFIGVTVNQYDETNTSSEFTFTTEA